MWSGTHGTVSPYDFKKEIAEFAPQFSGYNQHDSQEVCYAYAAPRELFTWALQLTVQHREVSKATAIQLVYRARAPLAE